MPTTRTATKQRLGDRVLNAIPGYAEAIERQRRLMPFANEFFEEGEVLRDLDRDFRARVVTAVDAGETNLDALRAEYTTARADVLARGQFAMFLRDAATDARNTAQYARENGTDEALEFLRNELRTLVGKVRMHRDTIAAHPASAEQALDLPDGAARWHLVTDLLAEYDEIRAEHRKILALNDSNAGSIAPIVGQTNRFLDVEPHWTYRRFTRSSADRPSELPWATTPTTGTINDLDRRAVWPHQISRPDWLLAIADDDEPWMPDAEVILESKRLADELIAAPTIDWFHEVAEQLTQLGVTVNTAQRSINA